MGAWSFPVQVFFLACLFYFDDLISIPSCKISGGGTARGSGSSDDLKVMMVADLMLKGSDATFVDLYFRDYYISKFLKKSLEKVKPDMLLVLGDMSSKGSELTVNKWPSILQQFQGMLGPFVGTPLHIVVGDRDIGECSILNQKTVSQIASSLPGLDSAGCGVFDISNVNFVSLNAVALLCNNNDLRFGVEKVIESERLFRIKWNMIQEKVEYLREKKTDFNNLPWIENSVELGSGPVLLLHFPLYRMPGGKLWYSDVSRDIPCEGAKDLGDSVGPYHQMQSLPPNATEYILYSLKPRIVFSAHTSSFCDYSHRDGTREVTVPAMTWAFKGGRPGLVVASFGQNKVVTVSHCSFAKESSVIIAYTVLLTMLILTAVLERWSYTTNLNK